MIRDNYNRILQDIADITKTNGIGQAVTLVAVTKNQPDDVFAELSELGVRDFAENRVPALEQRSHLMNGTRHLIGHLQTNKVKKALRHADLIHSVDSLHLAAEINRCCLAEDRTADILIQVNIAKEPQKFGVFEEDLHDLLAEVSQLPALRVRGLMAIMPIETKDEYYQSMYKLFRHCLDGKQYNNITMEILSMGMSNDYPTAVRYGANMIRVGRGLYL